MKPENNLTHRPLRARPLGRMVGSGWLGSAILILGLANIAAHGMNLWAALSQLESGNNDCAVGAVGEVSRYQIRPEVWVRYASPNSDWQTPSDALAVAKKVMRERCADFRRKFQREPSAFEFYLLWNAPAQVQRPSPVVRQRAERFCRLVQKAEAGKTPNFVSYKVQQFSD